MRVGPEVAKHDYDDCMARAEVTTTESGGSAGGNAVAGAATNSVAGAAAGGAGGAIFGNAGQGAAAGAVGGAVGSLTQAFYKDGFDLNRRNRRISNSSIIAFAKRATNRLPGNSGPEPHIQPVLIEPQLNATRRVWLI
jgi:hypothetical protein